MLIIHELPTPSKQLPGTEFAGDYEAIMRGIVANCLQMLGSRPGRVSRNEPELWSRE